MELLIGALVNLVTVGLGFLSQFLSGWLLGLRGLSLL